MRTPLRAAVVAAGLLTAAAGAQPLQISFQIDRVYLPSNNPFLLMLGDHAQISMTATVSPPVGTQVSYTPPPGPGVGTIAGLDYVSFDLIACDPILGAWTLSGTGFQGGTGTTWGLRQGWTLGSPGTPQTDQDVLNVRAGQLLFPGIPANPTNPVAEIWRGRWDPSGSGWGQQMRFTLAPHEAHVLIRYGADPNGLPLYASVPAAADSVSVQIWLDPGAPPPCFAVVDQQPQSLTVLQGGIAYFDATAHYTQPSGCGPFTYQWRRDCQPLQDGGRISGATTDTLRIDAATFGDQGQYDLVINNSAQTAGAFLTVTCFANCDGSTVPPVLNVNDFICFQARFAAGDFYANCDGSTTPPILNVNDFQCFLARFAAGCP